MFTKEQMYTPIWDTDIVWGESLMMIRTENGAAEAPLLYNPIEILKVTNLDGSEEYVEGVDWEWKNGRLRLTDDSRIYCFTEEEIYATKPSTEIESFPMNGRYLMHYGNSYFIERQIYVTYTCERGTWKGVRPQLADEKLPRSFELLRSGKNLNLVFYGDSITVGADASIRHHLPPYQEGYSKLVYDALVTHYGPHITYTNTAVGGKETDWAIENVEERVNAYAPDLVVLAFGMNDGSKTPEQFEERIRIIIGQIREKKPECEFVLVATSLPNRLLTDPKAAFWGSQWQFKEALDRIERDEDMPGVIVADITDMHQYLIAQKRFEDLSSNMINHPNDFFHRCYAQFLIGMLIDQPI